jgi:protein xylosyltransferase
MPFYYECDAHVWKLGSSLGKGPKGILYDGGSTWICLEREFVSYISNEKDDELIDGLKKQLNYVPVSSEIFFPTALRNSKFCSTWVSHNIHTKNWKRKYLGCNCQHSDVSDWCGCSPNGKTLLLKIKRISYIVS